MIDIKHLGNVQGMIVEGVKAETKGAILAKYSISDQLNATGTAATSMKTAIAAIISAGKDKQAAVLACKTFEELEAVVPSAE